MNDDEQLLARALASALTGSSDVAGVPLRRLGSGTDHIAFEAGGRFVVRVPKTDEAAARGAIERRLASLLAPRLPVAIPRFCLVLEPSEELPFGVSGYERLPGTPAIGRELTAAQRSSIARTLGSFLRVLHEVDASAVGLPPDDDPTREAWSAQAVEDVDAAVQAGVLDGERSASLKRYLAAPPAGSYVPCVVHGDLAAEHVLVEANGAVSGIIDWSDAMIGDRALDLAGLVHWGGQEILAEALATYGACDPDTIARARWFAACRAVADIVFGLDEQRAEYVAAGERALVHARL